MRRYLGSLAVLAALFCPAAGWAETITVRSGDHAGFSRLVLTFRDLPRWQIVKAGQDYTLRTGRTDAEFDVGAVFRFIGRTRVADVYQIPGTGDLGIRTNCPCRVSSSVVDARSIVIDVFDAPRPRPRRSGPDHAPLAAYIDGPVHLLQGRSASPIPNSSDVGAGTPLPLHVGPLPSRPAEPGPDVGLNRNAFSEMIARDLARQIVRAAKQGLVETDLSDTDIPVIPEPGGLRLPPVRIDPLIGRMLDHALDRGDRTPPSEACLARSEVDVASWGLPGPPGTQIANLRRAAVGEFDQPNPEVVLQLVRYYIHLSFGREARQVIETLGATLPDADLLLELSDLVENGGPTSGKLATQISCDGPVAFWAALALDGLPNDRRVDRDGILQAFVALPHHLRRHLGPSLSQRFIDTGDDDAAQTIANTILRVADPGDPAGILARAQIDKAPRSIEAELRRIAEGARPEAADALLLLIGSIVRRNEPVPQDLIDAAEILAFERQGTDAGAALKAAEIRARLSSRSFRLAFDALEDAKNDDMLPDPLLGEIRQSALVALTRNAEDGVFVTRVLDPDLAPVIEGAGRSVRFELAERLLGLGFPREASAFAEPRSDATDPEELRYAARVSLALGAPSRAAELARRATGADARRIVAVSLARAGRHREAADAFRELGDEEAQRSQLWRGGDWQRVARQTGTPESRAAKAFLEADQKPDQPPIPDLAALQERIGNAAELRGVLAELLGRSDR